MNVEMIFGLTSEDVRKLEKHLLVAVRHADSNADAEEIVGLLFAIKQQWSGQAAGLQKAMKDHQERERARQEKEIVDRAKEAEKQAPAAGKPTTPAPPTSLEEVVDRTVEKAIATATSDAAPAEPKPVSVIPDQASAVKRETKPSPSPSSK